MTKAALGLTTSVNQTIKLDKHTMGIIEAHFSGDDAKLLVNTIRALGKTHSIIETVPETVRVSKKVMGRNQLATQAENFGKRLVPAGGSAAMDAIEDSVSITEGLLLINEATTQVKRLSTVHQGVQSSI